MTQVQSHFDKVSKLLVKERKARKKLSKETKALNEQLEEASESLEEASESLKEERRRGLRLLKENKRLRDEVSRRPDKDAAESLRDQSKENKRLKRANEQLKRNLKIAMDLYEESIKKPKTVDNTMLDVQTALDAVDDMMVNSAFGSAGAEIVVEDFLDGEEASFFAVVGGGKAIPLVGAQDHKRVGEGDTGLNTGGMGAYSPAPVLTPAIEAKVMKDIIQPTVDGMAAEGCPFTGVIFAGLMIKGDDVKLLEHNVRFGDPECQCLMARMRSDLVDLLLKAAKGELDKVGELQWSEDMAINVVVAADGYPGSYAKGEVIGGLDAANAMDGVKVFHAGTAMKDGKVTSAGGRVLGVTATGKNITEAAKKSYAAVDVIEWPGGFVRRDIGHRAIAREK